MERLTKRELAELTNGSKIVLCNHKEEECNDSCMYGRCTWNKKALQKLKAYEDAEEQGLLLKLPCKVGDVVYRIGYSLCHRFESYGDSYTCIGCMDECTSERIVCRYIVPNLEWIIENMDSLNKLNVNKTIWYLSMEEAEAALKEMEK